MYMMSAKLYTTKEAAEAVGITRVTLQRWIARRAVRAPKPRLRNGVGFRLWSKADVARLRREAKEAYGKGQGRRPKKKKA